MAICELKPIKIDLKNPHYIYDRKCKQNDTLIFNFTVLDDNLPADLTGYSCIMNVNKNNIAYEVRDINIAITGNNVNIRCPSSVAQIAGTLKLELRFFNTSNGLQKSSFDIEIEVMQSVLGNANGTVPKVILTELQRLEESLAAIAANINQAEAIANTLNNASSNAATSIANINNAIGNGNISITNINNAISGANSAKSNLDGSISVANALKAELLNPNSAINQHLNNLDIHVTKDKKDKWDSYEARIIELTNIIDNYVYLDAYVINDADNVVDDIGNSIIV